MKAEKARREKDMEKDNGGYIFLLWSAECYGKCFFGRLFLFIISYTCFLWSLIFYPGSFSCLFNMRIFVLPTPPPTLSPVHNELLNGFRLFYEIAALRACKLLTEC